MRIREKYRKPEEIQAIATQCEAVFREAPEILMYEVARPTDVHTEREWQIMFRLGFRDQDSLEQWRSSRLHHILFEQFLGPMRAKMRVSNWTAMCATPGGKLESS